MSKRGGGQGQRPPLFSRLRCELVARCLAVLGVRPNSRCSWEVDVRRLPLDLQGGLQC